MSAAAGSLWRHGDFNRLWFAESVSAAGTAVSTLAIPTLAVLQLHADVAQVGFLVACERLPFPFLALPVGAWADRLRRRPLLISADAGRAILLAMIPVLGALGHLSMAALYVIVLLVGVLTVVFDVGYLAYFPALVGPRHLASANARLQVSFGAAELIGPGLGGVLVQWLGAARAVAVDAASYVVSALTLLRIRAHEERPAELSQRRAIRTEIAEGVGFVVRDRVLLSLISLLTLEVVFNHGLDGVVVVYAYQTLHLSPALFGAVLACEGVASIAGALLVPWVAHRLGYGPGQVVSLLVVGAAVSALGLATVLPPVAVLIPALMVSGLAGSIGNVLQVTLRQSVTPDRLQARMNSVFRTAYWGGWPLGSIAGGLVAAAAGPVVTIVGAGIGILLVGLVAPLTPLRRVRGLSGPPEVPPEPPTAVPAAPS